MVNQDQTPIAQEYTGHSFVKIYEELLVQDYCQTEYSYTQFVFDTITIRIGIKYILLTAAIVDSDDK